MKLSSVSSLLATTCALLAFVACADVRHWTGLDARPAYRELTELQPADIPVPRGFRLLTEGKESYAVDLGDGGFRQAHLVYDGPLAPDIVLRFYERSMPLDPYGWKAASANPKSDALHYVKGPYECRIRIRRIQVLDEERTRITVDLRTRKS